jgi:hypothetical protein
MRQCWLDLRTARDLTVKHTALIATIPASHLPPAAQQLYHSFVLDRLRALEAIAAACRRRIPALEGEQLATVAEYLAAVDAFRTAIDG